MMKIEKERKPFKREYIPIILAVLILFLLIAALIYLIGHDFKFEEETVNPAQPEQEEILIDNSNSKCSKEELDELYKLAEKINTETEMVEVFYETTMNDETGEPEDIYTWVAQFSIKDTDDKLYALVTNDYNEEQKEYKPEKNLIQFNGTPSFDIVTYTVEIKSNEYGCKGETIRKFTLKTKIFNNFYAMNECNDNPEFKYCQKFIDEDLPTFQIFKSEIEKYKKTTKTTNKTASNQNTTSVTEGKDNKKVGNVKIYIYVAIAILIGVGAIITLILVKKRRSKRV